MPQRVAVTGSSGLIGGALCAVLAERGLDVLRVVRREPRRGDEVRWAPGQEPMDPSALAGVSAVVHLAGAGVGDRRWNSAYRGVIMSSRVEGTRCLVQALAGLDRPIRLVSGSAVGFYGDDRGEERLTEASARGGGFLADVASAWEAEAAVAADAGHSVAMARTGIVLSRRGGALAKQLPLAKAGLGGPLGGGRQFWPWISLADEVAALAWLVEHPEVTGPVDLTGPQPRRQREVARVVGRSLHRPAVLPAPAPAVRLAVGGFAESILGSLRAEPTVLLGRGFTFQHPTLESAVSWALHDEM